jgi:hypothetical protein
MLSQEYYWVVLSYCVIDRDSLLLLKKYSLDESGVVATGRITNQGSLA